MGRGISRNVYVLGIVSFLTDVSSEMILPVLPLFMVDVLRAEVSLLGLMEGMAESAASILKGVAGWYSDRIGRRKPLVFFGYFISTVSKPFFALAAVWWHVLIVRFLDRVGKGIRTSPRDALIADSVIPGRRGWAFGLQRGLDTLGAVIGPLIAWALLSYYSFSPDPSLGYRTIFWLSAIPAAIAVLAVMFFVKEIAPSGRLAAFRWESLTPDLRRFLLITALFAVANFSYAFFILRAQSLGITVTVIPLLYLFFNIVYAGFSIPVGTLSDRVGRRPLILFAYLLFAALCAGFALAQPGSDVVVWLLFALYGVFMATFESVQKAYVSDLAGPELRATALGAYNGAVGLGALPASTISGLLWQIAGPAAAFGFGAAVAVLAALLLAVLTK